MQRMTLERPLSTMLLKGEEQCIYRHFYTLYTAKTGVLNLTPVGINRGPHPQVLTLHPRVST